MRYQGRITQWKDEQGYGFITPNGGGEPIFLHIKAFAGRGQRPQGDEIVTYQISTDTRGKPRASAVQFVHGTGRKPAAARQVKSRWPLLLIAVFFTLLGEAIASKRLPALLLAVCVGTSLLAFAAYALDKTAARAGRWRTRESTLHLLALIGGWPGALLAQRQFRHKTSKASFRIAFWTTVLLNWSALGWLSSTGRHALSRAFGLA